MLHASHLSQMIFYHHKANVTTILQSSLCLCYYRILFYRHRLVSMGFLHTALLLVWGRFEVMFPCSFVILCSNALLSLGSQMFFTEHISVVLWQKGVCGDQSVFPPSLCKPGPHSLWTLAFQGVSISDGKKSFTLWGEIHFVLFSNICSNLQSQKENEIMPKRLLIYSNDTTDQVSLKRWWGESK